MKRSLAVLVLILMSSAASAFVGMLSRAPRLDSVVSPGTLVTFIFEPFDNDVDEHDVTIDFTAAPATIESIESQEFACTASGSAAHCTRALFPKNTVGLPIKLGVRMPSTGGRITVNSRITAASGATYTWSPWVLVASPFYVTNTASDGAGSFRDAITRANAVCLVRQEPCEIDFQIPGAGPFTFSPDRGLPAITARKVAIRGEKQIILDGSGLQSPGLAITSEEIELSGFTIQNWGGPGILLGASPQSSPRAEIADSVLQRNLRGIMGGGTSFLYLHDNMISGNRFSGVWLETSVYPAVYENTIENNGASGVYFGAGCQFGMADDNQIRFNRDFGVAVSPQARWTEVRGNSMKGNGQMGIDYALDLVTPNVDDDSTRPMPNAPVLTSATYDALTGTTVIIGRVTLRKPADVGYYLPIVDMYSSTALDAYGMAQGEKVLSVRRDYGGDVGINRTTGEFAFTYKGNLTGQYVTATYTRMYPLGKGVTTNSLNPRPQYYENLQATSEMSNPVRVER
jgi:parallel beta-helix repeat protein